MFVIDKRNKIKLTKGDSATMSFSLVDSDGEAYELQENDVLTMTVKKPGQTTAAITKQAVDGYFILNPSDTANVAPGTYIYDVQLSNSSEGYVYTIVPGPGDCAAFFEISQEVTV